MGVRLWFMVGELLGMKGKKGYRDKTGKLGLITMNY